MSTRIRPRVLVVDDDSDIRAIVGLNLGLAGMEFGEACDGNEALDFLRMRAWDACILDLAMPRVDGFQVLKALSEEGITDQIAVIVLSSKASPAVAIEAMQQGAHAHLTNLSRPEPLLTA